MIKNSIIQIIDQIQGKSVPGAKRSSQWPTVRKAHLEKNSTCTVCGGKTKLEVHHIVPFHMAPERELDPENLITLCEDKSYGINCHLLIGHLGRYDRVNEHCTSDAEIWKEKLKKQ